MASRLTSVLADPGRLAAVRQTNLLDTPAEAAFDRVARLAARLLEVPIALVPLIEADRQFFKACVGLPEPWAAARQTPLSHSLCRHVVVPASRWLSAIPVVMRWLATTRWSNSSAWPPTSGSP
jgi:hypothetical protein